MNKARTSLVVGLAFASIMVDGFDLQVVGFLVSDMAREWSLPLASFGVVFSTTLIGTIAGATLAGFAARRIGLPATLIASLALFGVATLAAVLAKNISELVLLRFAAGIGLGAAVPVVVSLVAQEGPKRLRATLVTLTACGQPIGAIVGGAATAHFVPLYGWRAAFVLGGVIPLVLAALVIPVFGKGSRVADEASTAPSGEAQWRFADLFGADLRATTILLWMTAFCGSFFLYIMVNWLPGTMRSNGSSLEASILAISLFNFGGIAGALLAAAAMDRYGAGRVLPPLFGIAAVSVASLAYLMSEQAIYFAAALSGLAGYGAAVTLGALATTRYPAPLHALGIGWVLGMGRVGGAVSPLIAAAALGGGLVMQRLFWFAAIAAVLALFCQLALARAPSMSNAVKEPSRAQIAGSD
jgi:AAHS family 4-hydroxybenzoate transporter-like MFS transporter